MFRVKTAGSSDFHPFFPGYGVCNRNGLAGIIDEELFSGSGALSKANVQFASPLVITPAVLAVLISIGICTLILIPEEGNSFPSQLPLNIIQGGMTRLSASLFVMAGTYMFHSGTVKIVGNGPGSLTYNGAKDTEEQFQQR